MTPEHTPNGYRHYPTALVAILERVRDELQLGKTIGDLVRDPWWQQVFEAGRLPDLPPARIEPAWSALPLPASPRGRDIRERLHC